MQKNVNIAIETIQNLRNWSFMGQNRPGSRLSGVFDHFKQLPNGSDFRIALLTQTKDITFTTVH